MGAGPRDHLSAVATSVSAGWRRRRRPARAAPVLGGQTPVGHRGQAPLGLVACRAGRWSRASGSLSAP
jgi:hypothetical protein